MKKYGKLYRSINNLLSMLIASHAVEKVDEYYLKFNNNAPGDLLRREMENLQNALDNAKDK